MAYYAALVSLVQLLDDIILHHRYPTFLLRNHPLLESLHHKFTSLEQSLQLYSSNGDEVNDHFEGRIRDVAYRAQDIIEIQISNQIRLQESTSMNIMKKNCSPMLCFPCLTGNKFNKRSPMSCFGCFRGKKFNIVEEVQVGEQDTRSRSIVEEIQLVEQETSSNVEEFQMAEEQTNSIIEELRMVEQETNSILKEMMAIKERQQKNEQDSKLKRDSPTTSATVQTPAAQNTMVGFDEDLIIIKEHLCGQRSRLQVIPIVGMGGIGKTTLARNTFDDDLVAYHFDCHVWVTISQDYQENKALQIISESLKSLIKELPGGDGGDLKESIYKRLKGRRYLIVVDDIWTTQVWDDMKMIFPDDSNGSRIILTTRLLDVARYAISPSGFLHEVQLLNKEKSWNLLQKKVFAEECCPPELEYVGKLIASKCCGLPLAVVVIAGILSNFRTFHHWENIAGKVSTILSTSDEQMSRILYLSYNHLPHQLKACFLYLGSFPEDYEINISNLVRLWIADGLLKSNDSSKFAEKVGEECVEDLVKRNLVLIKRKRCNGQFKTCILHDLVRDFCGQRALHEFFFHVINFDCYLYPMDIENMRRINYYIGHRFGESSQLIIGKLARSINLYGGSLGEIYFTREFAWDDVKLLRVLNSWEIFLEDFRNISEEIFELLYLKYLSCDADPGDHSAQIFASLFKLQNLQTLVSSEIFKSIILPPQIWQMTQLRHLLSSEMILPSIPMVGGRMPIQKLECLQTLMTVVDCGFSNEVIKMIPNLRKLKVRGWGSDIKNLVHLLHLEELTIQDCKVISNFYFPSTLKKLSLIDCHIPWHDMTMVGSLPNLQVFKFENNLFMGEKWEPIEGEFLRLKFLQFSNLSLEDWKAENTHFPCLEYLKIIHCDHLEIPLEIGDIPTLKVIEVSGSRVAANSAIQIQENQRDMGNDALHVRIYDFPRPQTYMELSD